MLAASLGFPKEF